MENYSELVEWFYDAQNRPICSTVFTDYQCNNEYCQFSHEAPAYSLYVVLTKNLWNNQENLFRHLTNPAVYQEQPVIPPEAYEFGYQDIKDDVEEEKEAKIQHEVEDDIDQIDYLIKEMMNFEAGPEAHEESLMCPFLKETGNCLIRAICPYMHSSDEDLQKEIERKQQWYPASMGCECCKGYIFDCIKEDCKKAGECQMCNRESQPLQVPIS